MLIDFKQREGRERQKEWNINVRNTDQLPLGMLGTNSQPAMCPDQNPACDLLVYKTTLQPTEPHQPGRKALLINLSFFA